MSRLGKRPVALDSKLQASYNDRKFKVKGPKGELEFLLPAEVELELTADVAKIVADFGDSTAKMMAGTARSIIQNMVTGVSTGYSRKLILNGVGYRAEVSAQKLTMNLGYSNPVVFELPKGISAEVEGTNQLVLASCDKQLLGQTVAEIRSYRKPEPYKGKGILFENERIRRKAGKAGKTA